MIPAISIVIFLILCILLFLQHPKFGKTPKGKRLERIKNSPNFRNGKFQNLSHTPDLSEDATYFSVMKEFAFGKKTKKKPIDSIPHKKTDLLNLDPLQNVLVWFGHSSYFMQIDGKKILVDPVLSGAASPIAATTRSFKGANPFSVEDLPEIDYLFISHDHWDHLDYKSILKLKPKVKKIICGLGTGEHLEHWRFEHAMIEEHDWNERIELDEGFTAFTAPARHFSGRSLSRNNALWVSFVLQTPSMQIFLGGDSGYDSHFKEIGQKYGEFDLVILENGQYDKSWKYIHMTPNEVLHAAKDLNAKCLLPVHSAKFSLANHAWDEPLSKITELNKTENLNLITPMIGEVVDLKNLNQQFSNWWEGVN